MLLRLLCIPVVVIVVVVADISSTLDESVHSIVKCGCCCHLTILNDPIDKRCCCCPCFVAAVDVIDVVIVVAVLAMLVVVTVVEVKVGIVIVGIFVVVSNHLYELTTK